MCRIPDDPGLVVNISERFSMSDDKTRVESGAVAEFR